MNPEDSRNPAAEFVCGCILMTIAVILLTLAI